MNPCPDFDNVTFEVAVKNLFVSEKGPIELIFEPIAAAVAPAQEQLQEAVNQPDEQPHPQHLNQEDVMNLIVQGVPVDDDREPVEENIPRPGDANVEAIFNDWGFAEWIIAAQAPLRTCSLVLRILSRMSLLSYRQ